MGRSSKRRKQRHKLENYEVLHVAPNKDIFILRVQAHSLTKAQAKIGFFVNLMELCSSATPDEEILNFITANEPSASAGGAR